jgi:nucleotide-binding universal stress UspA family protein
MKVLLAVDGSGESLSAVHEVGQLLKSDRDQAILYTRSPDAGAADVSLSPRIAHNQELLGKAILNEAAKRLPKEIIPRNILGVSDPRRGIILAAEQSAADLIVVGARGLGMLQRLLIGSVSSAVVHSSRIPVWVYRPRASGRSGLRVLVACHDPESARIPARLLSHFAWPGSTSFTLIVSTTSFYGAPIPEWLQQQSRSPDVEELVQRWAREREQEKQALRSRLQAIAGTLQAPLGTARIEVAEGNPAEKILSTITEEQIDLVVIGSHTHRPLIGTLLGSTAEAILNHAPCSVLVMPHQEQP